MPLLLARNTMPGPTVWAKPGKDTVAWGPAGTQNDTRRIPESMMEDPDFLESIDHGTIVIEGAGEEMDARMAEFAEFTRAKRAQREQDLSGVMDRRQQRDILAEDCVGPGPAGRTTGCGASIQRPASQKSQTPPLCPAHAGLINEYVLSQEGNTLLGQDGQPAQSRWVRYSLG